MSKIVQLKDSSGDLFPRCAINVGLGNSGGTTTFTLPNGTYLIVITRTNASTPNKIGMYIVRSYPTNGTAGMLTIAPSSSLSNISITNETLSVTTSDNYVRISILQL